jgi:hypothetical protein
MKRYLGLYVTLALVAALLSALLQSRGAWDDSAIKALLVPIAAIFLDLFNSPATAVILSAAIVITGLALSASFWFGRVRPVTRELRELGDVASTLKPLPDRDERRRRLADLFDRSGIMRREYALYAGRLDPPAPERGSAGGAAPSRPRAGDYLDLAAVERAGVGLGSFGQLSSHVVGIGLVLTFCGLVAGLYFASKGLVAADLATARTSLVQLLQAATFKFLTSIAGIATSIVIALVHQRAVGRITAALDELNLTLDESAG